MPSTANVRVGSPKIGGYAFSAPLGTAVPTNAVTALAAAYLTGDLGYITEDGVTITPNVETEDIRDWGGDVIRVVQTEVGAEVTVTLAEAGQKTLEEVFGEDNVTLTTGALHVAFTGESLPHKQYSFELKDGDKVGRVVINDGQVTTPGGGERTYTRSALRTFPVTIKCFRDASGAFYHEYEDDEV